MKKLFYLFIFIFFISLFGCINKTTKDQKTSYNVKDYPFPCNLKTVSTEEYKKFPKFIDSFRSFSGNMPIAVDLSVNNNFPPVGNQGKQGSCASWALAYYYKSFQERQYRKWDFIGPSGSIKSHIFSPSFIYNHFSASNIDHYYEIMHHTEREKGSNIVDEVEYICHKGCATIDLMPYIENNDIYLPSTLAIRESKRFINEMPFRLDYKASSIKAHLAYSHDPVVIGIPVFPSFYDIKKDTQNTGRDVYTSLSGIQIGGHAITIVGYDDNKVYRNGYSKKYGAFKFINSWGADWGDDGYGWISYDIINQIGSPEFSSFCPPPDGTNGIWPAFILFYKPNK